MQNIKEYLYILALKTYLIDRKSEIVLDNKFLMNINIQEFGEWVDGRVLYCIDFLVSINNGQTINNVVYKVNSWRNLSTVLSTSDASKLKFIFNRTFLSLNRYHRITTIGKIKNNELSKAILNETFKQLRDLKNNENTKINKKIKTIRT